MTYGYVQARLFALLYPRECEEMISRVLADSRSTTEDLLFVTRTLGTLVSQGSGFAESELLKLARSKEPTIARRALTELFESDSTGRHRALYWSKISEGVWQVYDLGPYWADVQTKEVFQHLAEASASPESRDPRNVEALERLAILESPNRTASLEKILSGIPDPDDYSQKISDRLLWALRVVQVSPTDNALAVMQKRLEHDEVTAASFQSGRIVAPPTPVSSGYVYATGDDYYDEVLLAYQAMGGKLNNLQKERLTYYGYLGDPKERLNKLMEEGGK